MNPADVLDNMSSDLCFLAMLLAAISHCTSLYLETIELPTAENGGYVPYRHPKYSMLFLVTAVQKPTVFCNLQRNIPYLFLYLADTLIGI